MDPEDRLDPRRYNLSEIQLSYLLGDDIGTRTESELDSEINEVASNLGARLQYLIEDIAILHSRGYLRKVTEGDDQLPALDRSDELFDPPVAYRGLTRGENDYIQLAISLGHVLRLVYGDTASEFDERLIGMGVLLGLNGAFLKENWSSESSIESFLETLPEDDEYFETFHKPSDETLEDLQDVIQKLENSISVEPATDTDQDVIRNELEKSKFTVTAPLVKTVEARTDETGYPRIESVVNQVIETLQADVELDRIETLSEQLVQDIEVLETTAYRKATAIDVFYGVYQQGEYVHTSDIAEAANTDTHQASKFLNDFEGRDSPWSKRPLVTETDHGYTPTAYGRLVGQLLSDNDSEAPYSIPTEEEITTTCHQYLLGHDTDDNQELIEEILID